MTPPTAELLTLGQWLSPAYPVGGFAWSQGLEAAVAEGQVTDAAGLADWLAGVLEHGSGRNDAILLACAWRAEGDDLADLAELAAALAPSAARAAETREQGAAFAACTRAVWGLDLPDMAFPVAVGRAARLAGLPVAPVLALWLQSVASNLVQAALRLMPLGQTAGQRVLHGLAPLIARLAQQAPGLGLDDLGSATLAADIAGMCQEALQPRIFRS
ncbi:MAG: urease accessory protein UreF [Rhodobacteraceae bacterium HLUCCA08]|nr:MAG: urease accessory protein UreF [Rhodobacteraceae bacterium HLUCCA08]